YQLIRFIADLGAAVCVDHRAHSGPVRRCVGARACTGDGAGRWPEVRPVPTSRRSHRRLTNTRLRFETSDLRPDESTTNIGLVKAGLPPSPSTSTSRCWPWSALTESPAPTPHPGPL